MVSTLRRAIAHVQAGKNSGIASHRQQSREPMTTKRLADPGSLNRPEPIDQLFTRPTPPARSLVRFRVLCNGSIPHAADSCFEVALSTAHTMRMYNDLTELQGQFPGGDWLTVASWERQERPATLAIESYLNESVRGGLSASE